MMSQSQHDAWQAGDRYENYMGRWSRLIAPHFLDWLAADEGLDWLDVGCGTGALSATIVARCNPADVIGVDQSEGFVAAAKAGVPDGRASFQVADATALPLADASRDVVVSALMLNFVPDKPKVLAEMRRVARPDGRVAFYVWDYPGGGMGLMRAFWTTAVALDPAANEFSEDRRFPFCAPDGLTALALTAGLSEVECTAIETETVFRDFEDYWRPFTQGTGPAPGYCASLAPDARERLRQELSDSLPRNADGAIALPARAWAIRGISA